VALTRFKRTLRRARLTVRQLTHTLRLPPALSEIYGGPNAFWLRDVLENLPNLQSLIVSQLPFFDHHSLIALRYASTSRRPSLGDVDERTHYDLKLLLAERESNTTSAGLREALFHFPHLVYLDLSYTSPARDVSVLSAFANLRDLQVLKLRGIGLRDGEAEVLANAIGIRVRLLDLRENHLTDIAVRSLMQACFLPPDRLPTRADMNTRQTEDWPVGMAPGPDFMSLDSLRSEELDRQLLKQLTHPLTGRLAFEDIPHKGLTHLYVADNNLSVEGLSSLLKSTRLHVLDAGSVKTIKTISLTKSLSSPPGCQGEVRFPGAEKLVPVLAADASHNLTYLRVSHTVATEAMPNKEPPSPIAAAIELQSQETAVFEAPAPACYAVELSSQATAIELQSQETAIVEALTPAHRSVELPSQNEAIFELSAQSVVPRSELPGDCIHFASSPPVNTARDQGVSIVGVEGMRSKTGDAAFAPEIVATGATEVAKEGDEEVVLNASGSGLTSKKPPAATSLPNDITHAVGQPHDFSNTTCSTALQASHAQGWPSRSRLARIETLLRNRQSNSTYTPNSNGNLTKGHLRQAYTYLHPSHLPNLRTLVLTGVPTHVPASSPTIPALLRFISACADEAYLALLRAQTSYSLPPGHSRHAAEVQHARSLFALRTIVLEMGTTSSSSTPTGKAWDHSRAKLNMLKSSTGDRDSEALWSAAENDFSFFGEEGEEEDECGIYQNEPEKYFPTAIMDEKIICHSDVGQHHDDSAHGSVSPFCSLASTSPSMLQTTTLSPTILQSPRNLPLGKTRRSSSGASNTRKKSLTSTSRTGTPLPSEMTGTVPASSLSHPPPAPPEEENLVDLVAELAKFRREKKKKYNEALLKWRTQNNPNNPNNPYNHTNLDRAQSTDDTDMAYVEGHWKGKIEIVRNAAPKGRTGVVDIYGNYFEKGYLYP
jgi:hypothetical protein